MNAATCVLPRSLSLRWTVLAVDLATLIRTCSRRTIAAIKAVKIEGPMLVRGIASADRTWTVAVSPRTTQPSLRPRRHEPRLPSLPPPAA